MQLGHFREKKFGVITRFSLRQPPVEHFQCRIEQLRAPRLLLVSAHQTNHDDEGGETGTHGALKTQFIRLTTCRIRFLLVYYIKDLK